LGCKVLIFKGGKVILHGVHLRSGGNECEKGRKEKKMLELHVDLCSITSV
jgi:hypothetical protein